MARGLNNPLTVGRKLYRVNGRCLITTNPQTLDFLPESLDKIFNLYSQPAPFGAGRGLTWIIEAKGWLATDYRTYFDLVEVGPFTRFDFDQGQRQIGVLVNAPEMPVNRVIGHTFSVNHYSALYGGGNIAATISVLRRPMIGSSDASTYNVRGIKMFTTAELNSNPKTPEILALNNALIAAFPVGSDYHPSLLPPGWESIY